MERTRKGVSRVLLPPFNQMGMDLNLEPQYGIYRIDWS